MLHTGEDLLTDTQKIRRDALFANEAHIGVQTTWAIYQDMIANYRNKDPKESKTRPHTHIGHIATDVTTPLPELKNSGTH